MPNRTDLVDDANNTTRVLQDIEDKEIEIREILNDLPDDYLSKAFVAIQTGLGRQDSIESVRRSHGKALDYASRNIMNKRLGRAIIRTGEEIETITRSLEEIAKIRRLQTEIIHLGRRSSRPLTRRGNLISQLHHAATVLPLYIPNNPTDPIPIGCGNTENPDWTCEEGDRVVMQVEAGACSGNSNWILGEVIRISDDLQKFEVEDVDTESGGDIYLASRQSLIPLPKWRVNPCTNPSALFPKNSTVLALFPQTTCFYIGHVLKTPTHPHGGYVLRFEDVTYPDGLSPPMEVPQLYVVSNHVDAIPATHVPSG